jgi:hypothetical protein
VRRLEDIHATGLQDTVRDLKVWLSVVRMKMFQELIAEYNVYYLAGQVEIETVIYDQAEIVGNAFDVPDLIRNINSINVGDMLAQFK